LTAADRNAWLALTREEAIEPDLPVCDPHHHLWDHPGSRYLAEEFLLDVSGDGAGHNLVSTVFVECLQFYRPDGPEELRPVGETAFIDSVAGNLQASGHPLRLAAGIVGYADLTRGRGAAEVLDAHLAASPRFRGVRHASAWDPSERIHNAHTNPGPNLLQDAEFRQGLACLEELGLSFDAWLYHPQIPQLVDLAQAFPGLSIVLDHMAGPLGIGPYAAQRQEVFAEWRAGMAALAQCSNVFIKLGGRTMSMAGYGWHNQPAPPGSAEIATAVGDYCRVCIDLFGPERCMFESNFPVDRASCSYTILWNAFKRISAGYAPAERAALLHDTASRFYRL
jgi:predicted TIM-barrel fold metal-dependent hydrolase